MPLRLSAADSGFERAFAEYTAKGRETAADVTGVVADIIADVRARGDAAVRPAGGSAGQGAPWKSEFCMDVILDVIF